MESKTSKQKPNLTGILFTIIVSIGLGWAIYRLAGLSYEPVPLTAGEIKQNEIEAYRNIKRIAEAQDRYVLEDRDGDGKKQYAVFYIHLWTTISRDGERIRLEFIPRELGFAMEVGNSLSGYYFMDLRKRRSDRRTAVDLNYENEWALAAIPAVRGQTGNLTFIIDQGKKVYATPNVYLQPEYPVDPVGKGWVSIEGVEDLE
jgi:hypothetical protein